MSNPDKPGNKDDKVVHLPAKQHSTSRQVSGQPIKIVEEESVVPINHLFLADAKLQAHQAEVLMSSFRDETLKILKEADLLREDQIEIDPETGDCFILAENGESMGLSEYIRHVGRKRIQEEADKYRAKNSDESV